MPENLKELWKMDRLFSVRGLRPASRFNPSIKSASEFRKRQESPGSQQTLEHESTNVELVGVECIVFVTELSEYKTKGEIFTTPVEMSTGLRGSRVYAYRGSAGRTGGNGGMIVEMRGLVAVQLLKVRVQQMVGEEGAKGDSDEDGKDSGGFGHIREKSGMRNCHVRWLGLRLIYHV
ncbi:hypothetical protein BT96DRAFT_951746 [Gymnopus androsaceus JB14]|uniref:Uncharacterized protein n=1 Tax=Gymnopus androsaceus JB14 TaxID=1447944 RepID=A0A6A4GBQ0_9AGAR|nr:hypothetical protein BT96DRAFT_951746 [Gymnopus androsaceus JB14]